MVLNWNGADDTIRCLRSLQELDYPSREVIVVDNGSTDNSPDAIALACPAARLIRSPINKGWSAGNNIGVRAAVGRGADYVWLVNNDVVVERKSLSQMVDVAEADATVGGVGCLISDAENPERVQAWGGARVTRAGRALRHTSPPRPEHLHYLVGASVLLRAKALENIGLLDEGYFMYWDDADLGFRLRAAGWKLVVAEAARVWHQEGASLRDRVRVDALFSVSAVRFFRRHSSTPLLPVGLNVAARIARRVLKGDWSATRAIWTGTVASLRKAESDTGRPLGRRSMPKAAEVDQLDHSRAFH